MPIFRMPKRKKRTRKDSTPEELKRFRNFGQKRLEEVTEKLAKFHLELREDGE